MFDLDGYLQKHELGPYAQEDPEAEAKENKKRRELWAEWERQKGGGGLASAFGSGYGPSHKENSWSGGKGGKW